MARTFQISKWAEAVAQEGAAGRSMQAKLAELAESNDMDQQEIRRVAEVANRQAQNALYKVAADKRFKFALADANALIGERQKSATASNKDNGSSAKMASAINEAGGDPFAPLPSTERRKLSLYEVPLNENMAAEQEVSELRGMILKLGQTHTELEAMKEAGRSAILEIEGHANMAHDLAVENALQLLRSGVTLVDLYAALRAAVSGTRAGPDAMKQTDQLALILIDGIKDRGMPNSRLGFRYTGDVNVVDELSSEDILALCRRAAGIPDHEGIGITMATQKTAQMLVTLAEGVFKSRGPERHPFEDAAADLGLRHSTSVKYLPAHYLDEAFTNNTPNGKPVVLNGDVQFVIGVKDLIGAQQRLAKCHAAQEFLGLKLQQIEATIRELQKTKEGIEAKKEALLPAIAGIAASGVASALGSAAGEAMKTRETPKPGGMVRTGSAEEKGAGVLGAIGKGLSSQTATNAIGAAGIAASTLPFVAKTKDQKANEAAARQSGVV
jgi:hypothetical protein